MGIYAVTGGTKGIGEKTVEILRSYGNEVINIDIENGDINADLGTTEGRELVISQLHKQCPDGLDGLVCNHGITGLPIFKPSYILSVNYFGAVAIIEGLYDLLKMRKGNCAVTASGAIAYAKRGKYFVDGLLNNCGDEARICRLVDTFDSQTSSGGEEQIDGQDDKYNPRIAGNAMYLSSKIALAQWVRRVSSTWAAHGVNINAVAPGAVATSIMHGYKKPDAKTFFYPMPALTDRNGEMDPTDIAHVLAFLVMPGVNGVSGSIMFCDAGASAIIDPEKY